MALTNDAQRSLYVVEAVAAFNEIMSANRQDAMERLNRVNKGELFVLRFLASRATPVLPSELSAALQSSSARISALLRTLEKKGQIEREVDASNRRNILVTLTEAGRERVGLEREKMQAYMAQIFSEMGESDTLEFIRLIKRFAELMHSYHVCFGCDS